jgi:hypothetical protein
MSQTDKPLTCTVNRKTWVRGRYLMQMGMSALLNQEGNMCCLGFLGEACGVPKEKMLYRVVPSSLPDELGDMYPKVNGWSEFMFANDRYDTTDAEKEKELRQLAKKHGFRFRFVGK